MKKICFAMLLFVFVFALAGCAAEESPETTFAFDRTVAESGGQDEVPDIAYEAPGDGDVITDGGYYTWPSEWPADWPTPEPAPPLSALLDPEEPSRLGFGIELYMRRPDTEQIKVMLHNNYSDTETVLFWDLFEIERFENDEWVLIPRRSWITVYPQCTIPPGAHAHSFPVRLYTDGQDLEPGRYRIVMSYGVEEKHPDANLVGFRQKAAYVEFAVDAA